jgi:two-component system sensor histidine kinase BaeS
VVFCVVLVSGSIATTAAIVSRSATASIQHEYSQNVVSAAEVYNRVLGWAATHPSWTTLSAAELRRLVPGARDVTITTSDHRVLVASSPDSPKPGPTAVPVATVNALAPDSRLSTAPLVGGIDGRAVGPFALPAANAAMIDAAAQTVFHCLTSIGYADVATARYPNGREYVRVGGIDGLVDEPRCATVRTTPQSPPAYGLLTRSTASETAAARELARLFGQCADGDTTTDATMLRKLSSQLDFVATAVATEISPDAQACLASARRLQLAKYVAPAALLYIAGDISARTDPGLSGPAVRRIIIAALLILLVAVLAVLLAASGVTRPLRALTQAIGSVRDRETPTLLPTSGSQEIAALANAFNEMSAELVAAEARRRSVISDVAHELRTPLGNIHGWLEVVQDGIVRPDPPLITSLLDESRLLQTIIDDLQVLALADADQLVIHPEPIDFADVLTQTIAAQRPHAAQKAIELVLEMAGDLRCNADPNRARQFVGNLVSNAIRYTDHGSVTVTATGSGDDILFTVDDTGIGIDSDDLAHVFDRFWRAEKSRDRRRGGSGLGLAIARQLVRAHEGDIEIASEPGRGTQVHIRLPRHE